MTVTCPGCGRKLNVSDSAIGKTVACPACRTAVTVEEELRIMPAGDVSSPDAGGVIGPAIGKAAASCPKCGFPLLPTMAVCNRCGTDRFTGQQDVRRAGYQAGLLKKVLGRSGWVLTLLVLAGIACGVYVVVTKAREWARKKVSDAKAGPAGKRTRAGASTRAGQGAPQRTGPAPAPAPAGSPPGAGGGEAAKPPPAQQESPAVQPVDPEQEIAGRFEAAFALLADPLPESQKRGRRQLTALGVEAVPHLAKRYSEAEDPAVRRLIVEMLARLRQPAATAKLSEALGDADDDVREAAILGLVSRGKQVFDLVAGVLESGDPRARGAAIQIVGRLSLEALVPGVVGLLADPAPEVRWEAARCLEGTATPDAYPKLMSSLDDECLDVAVAAAEALASHPESLPLVLARFEKLPGAGGGQDAGSMLFLLSVPILASKDAKAAEKLTDRICADRPIPKVIASAKRILSGGVTSRMQAISAARTDRSIQSLMAVIAGVSLMDRDGRIQTAAIRHLALFPSVEMAMPLVMRMDGPDVDVAMWAAREVGRLNDASVADVLRAAAKGPAPLRRVLAAGVLAQRKDTAGAEILLKAATRGLKVPSPVPAWAAYQLSFLGDKDLAGRFAAEAAAVRSGVERAYYIAAAARLGDEAGRKQITQVLAGGKLPAETRVELVGLLSAEDPDGAKSALLAMLREPSMQLQISALAALADIGDAEVIPEIMELMPSFTPVVAEAARAAAVRFGKRAEPGLLTSLSATERGECVAALETLAALGRNASRTAVEAVIEVMMARQGDPVVIRLAGKALEAMTGHAGKPEWTGADWAKAEGLHVTAPEVSGKQEWGWLSIDMPKGWIRRRDVIVGNDAPGRPMIRVLVERDPPEGDDPLPPDERRYADSLAMCKARATDLAMRRIGDQYVPLPNVTVQRRPGPTVGSGQVRTRTAALLFYSKTAPRATYYIFVVVSGKEASWYGELECSVDSQLYASYQKLFEKSIPKSLKIDQGKMK